jgi:hypothetical protein
MAYLLSWLAEALEDAGLRVAEQPGWRTRGRGEMAAPRGVMIHQTGSPMIGNAPSLGVITEGREDLPGPFAQLCLGRDGTFYVVAAGRAAHAGKGEWQGVASGNASFVAIQVEHFSGEVEEPWPEAQLQALSRGTAAILKRLNADAALCCGHKEYAQPLGRAADPDLDMDQLRQAIAVVLAGQAPPLAQIPPRDPYDRATLRRGDRGDDVASIQKALRLKPDGMFSAQTEAAVRAFQRKKGLLPDGVVGPKTWAAAAPTAAPALQLARLAQAG